MILTKKQIFASVICTIFALQAADVAASRLKGHRGFWSHRALQGTGRKGTDVWTSGDGGSTWVEASVSKSKHDKYVKKEKDDYKASDSEDEPKNKSNKEAMNRPPEPSYTSKDPAPKGGSKEASSPKEPPVQKYGSSYDDISASKDETDEKDKYDKNYKDKEDEKGEDKEYKSDKDDSSPKNGKSQKSSSSKGVKGAKGAKTKKGKDKSGGKDKSNGGGGIYDGGSYDGGSTEGGKESKNKDNEKDKPSDENTDGGSVMRPPPGGGYNGQDGRPLTGVPVTRFSLLYTIDQDLGMPLTSDFEAVHQNTFLWLYTVMFRAYGDQLKNLLTDDTSNVYTENQPTNIEYASVALFDENDPDIPTREQLDQLVLDAFSGSNLDTYIEGVQNLPSANPFSSTSNVEFRRNTPGSGRNAGAGGDLMNKVSSKGLIPPLVAAATLFVVLAGGAVMYKKKRSDMQEMKGGQWLGVETATMNDCTASLDTRTAAEKRGFSQNRQNEASNDRSINIPEKEKQIDPDLQGWSEFFETAEERADHVEEDKSQYSIEDFTEFVNEQERSVLHARIRYPDTPASNTSTVSKDSERTDPQSI